MDKYGFDMIVVRYMLGKKREKPNILQTKNDTVDLRLTRINIESII